MDWAKAKREYVTSSISQEALAVKYGVSYISVRRRAQKERWVALRAETERKTSEKIVETASQLSADARATLYKAALEWARTLVGYTREDLEALKWKPRDVTGALKDCADILDLKSDEDIEEQKARIEKLRRDARQEDDRPQTITVTIQGDKGWTD